MKTYKKVIIFIVLFAILAFFARNVHGFNFQFFDTTWYFNEAQIAMPDGEVIRGPVDTWKDYEDSDMVQVVINDIAYYTHGSNVVLIKKGE
jgi:hypothetical protein